MFLYSCIDFETIIIILIQTAKMTKMKWFLIISLYTRMTLGIAFFLNFKVTQMIVCRDAIHCLNCNVISGFRTELFLSQYCFIWRYDFAFWVEQGRRRFRLLLLLLLLELYVKTETEGRKQSINIFVAPALTKSTKNNCLTWKCN